MPFETDEKFFNQKKAAAMKSISIAGFLIYVLTATLTAQDIEGSKDHPLITRYPGSSIKYFEEQKFTSYNIAHGPQTGYKQIKQWIKADGKLTRIYYVVKGNTTVTEIYRNYLTALNKGGFTILAQGIHDSKNVSQEIGGRTFLITFYENNPLPVDKDINIINGSATSGGSAYIAAQLARQGGEAFITAGFTQYKTDEKLVMVDILEKTKMEDDLIKVNADEMLKGIRATGKAVLYGIYFDFDKAEVKPESKPALEEIPKLLKLDAGLKLFIVGHTDMTGAYEYNMALSAKRAEAIIKELVNNYDVTASRLSAAGVGPLAPIAANATDEGRKLNRRVELIAR